ALTFTIKNGKKNGPAKWYGRKGIVLMEGSFADDDKTGDWKVYDKESNHIRTAGFHKGLREGLDIFFHLGDTVAVTNYISDEMDGEVRVFYKDRLAMRGQIEEDDEVGKWIYYHPNGNLASRYTYRDTSGEQIIPFLYRSDLVRSYEQTNYYSSLVDEKIRDATKLSKQEVYDSLGITAYDIYYQNVSMYDGKFEEFNYDGKPSDIRNFKGGYLTSEPNRYDFQGRILEEVIIDKKNDSLQFAHHIKNNYQYGYSLYRLYTSNYYEEHFYWRNKTMLRSIQHLKPSKKEIKKDLATNYTYYHFYKSYFDSVKNRDTIVVIDYSLKDNKDTVSVKRIHLSTGYTFKDGDDKLSETFNKKGKLVNRRTAIYDEENDKMMVENSSFNKEGNIVWVSHSSYFDDTYTSDSTVLTFNGKRYHGKIEYETKKGKKGGAWMEGDILKVQTTGIKRNGTYDNGRINGVWDQFDDKGNKSRSTTYIRGEKFGPQKYWLIKKFNSKKRKEEAKKYGIEGKSVYYLKSTRTYDNNKLVGDVKEYFWNGQQSSQGTFDHGKKNGEFKTWDMDGNPISSCKYVNDTIDGVSTRWSKYSNRLISVTDYRMGLNEGVYKQWDASGNPVVIGQAKGDYKDGVWLNYYSDSVLKSKTVFNALDSVEVQSRKDRFKVEMYKENTYSNSQPGEIRNTSTYYDIESFSSRGGSEPGEYTFYFKTGEVSRTGVIKDWVRSGIWKIWDEGGTLIREINYESGEHIHTREDGTVDTIQHYGSYKSWHSSGNKEVEGFILSEYNSYDCYQEVDISVQDLFYVDFWDDEGNHSVKNGSGYLFLYDRSARPTSEGFVNNGARHGLWKFRDKDGGLNEIGHFVDGFKNGKWYEGDLIGMHFVDDACFDLDNTAVKKKVAYDQNILSVTIVYYDLGFDVNRISYENNTNPQPLSPKKRRKYTNYNIIDF
ncbi:MAG: antitoxin component YwqK of YwqJK toxin-antitoxin module, partial [Parvicellaceae bacterium]